MGVGIGLILGRITKQSKAGHGEISSISAEKMHRLNQLKSQLDSGLITMEEYETKKQELLKEL